MTASRRLKYNTREKLISNDANRAQSFGAADRENIFRALLNDARFGFHRAPGLTAVRGAVGNPIAADVISGLLVRPDSSTSLTIDPGVVFFWTGTGAVGADDTPHVLCVDPGQPSTGVITFTANVGAGPRLDVLECRPIALVTESGNRDVFNTGTGAFVPTMVDKVVESRLEYRLRLGVANAGFPGTASGWLPLAVICVQVGAANFAQCDLWDVRPLVDDRVPQSDPKTSHNFVLREHPLSRAEYQVVHGGGSVRHYQGFSDSQYDGYFAGGELIRSTASSLANFGSALQPNGGDALLFDPTTTENHELTFALPVSGNTPVFVAAVFPHGLPRWVRYSQVAIAPYGVRIPRGPRGILVVTRLAPQANGAYIANLHLPNICGFTGFYDGVALAAQLVDTTSHRPGVCQNGWHRPGLNAPSDVFLASTTNTGTVVTFTLPDAAFVPVWAKEVEVDIRATAVTNAGAANVTALVTIEDLSGNTIAHLTRVNIYVATGPSEISFPCRIPLNARAGHLDNARGLIRVRIIYFSATATGTVTMTLRAWSI